jgi:hypothetical protein
MTQDDVLRSGKDLKYQLRNLMEEKLYDGFEHLPFREVIKKFVYSDIDRWDEEGEMWQDIDISRFEDNKKCRSSVLICTKVVGVKDSLISFMRSKQNVVNLVKHFLEDAVKLTGLDDSVTIQESPSTNCVGDALRDDVMLVRVKMVPVVAALVKLPPLDDEASTNDIDDPKVSGEMFDHLTSLQNAFGVRPLGIVSDGRSWRVCWLPSESCIARANTEDEVQACDPPAPRWDANDRRLCVSRMHDTRESGRLLQCLASALLKVCSAKRQLDVERYFAAYDASRWYWSKLPSGAKNRSLELGIPAVNDGHNDYALVVHSATRGYRIIATNGTGLVYEVKVFSGSRFNAKRCDDEKAMWNTVWGVQVEPSKLAGEIAVYLPLIVPLLPPNSDRQDHRFPSTVAELMEAIMGDVRVTHSVDNGLFEGLFAELMRRGMGDFDARKALEDAVGTMTSRGLSLDDLEWRHVGLVMKDDGLHPVLRCVQKMYDTYSETIARESMQDKVKALLQA